MKKTLIALAAVAATSAFAADSVTLYGVADVGFKNNDTGFTSGINGTPRLGVKGEESLGGGLTGYFLMEAAIDMTTGNNATAFGARGAYVGVKGSFGSVDMGASRLSPSFYAAAAIDPNTTNNYSVYNPAGGARLDNSINYTSNSMGGVIVRASTVLADNNAGNALYDLSAVYGAGPLTIAAAYTDAGTAKNGSYVGAAYNLGVAVLSASMTTKVTTGQDLYNVGVRAPMGALTLAADMSKNKDTGVKSSVVAAQYALSKRTSLTGYVMTKDGADNEVGAGIRHNF